MLARLGARAALPRLLRGRCRCSDATVAIDTSGLIGRRGPHAHEPAAAHMGLMRELASHIQFRGPLTVAEFMSKALTHPVHGYYMRRDVFGREGDFTTSPEVSQVFGELIGVWCVASWEMLGRPAAVSLVEPGPGRGTLMADVLRATAPFADFQRAATANLIEVSPHLRRLQRRTLSRRSREAAAAAEEEEEEEDAAADGAADAAEALDWRLRDDSDASVRVEWRGSVDEVPRGAPVLLIAHEFLDALPAHQVRTRPPLSRVMDAAK